MTFDDNRHRSTTVVSIIDVQRFRFSASIFKVGAKKKIKKTSKQNKLPNNKHYYYISFRLLRYCFSYFRKKIQNPEIAKISSLFSPSTVKKAEEITAVEKSGKGHDREYLLIINETLISYCSTKRKSE